MHTLVGTFCQMHPNQKIFEEFYNAKFCIKKIKDIDVYYSYLAYAEYNYILNNDYQIDKILKQMISKYPHRIETYLRYWQLLIKGNFKNLTLAHKISEVCWKNSSILNLEDNIYQYFF